jgi:hypothetical protein
MTNEERIKALEVDVAALQNQNRILLEAIADLAQERAERKRPSWEDTHRAFVPEARRIAGEG